MQKLTALQLHGVPLPEMPSTSAQRRTRGSLVRTAPANAEPSIFKCRYACRRRPRWPMQAARISACPRLEYAALGQATRMAEDSEGPSRRRDALEYARFLEDLSRVGRRVTTATSFCCSERCCNLGALKKLMRFRFVATPQRRRPPFSCTTGPPRFPSSAAAIRPPIVSDARRRGSASRCAYRCVVDACVCPNSLPMIGRLSPPPAPKLA